MAIRLSNGFKILSSDSIDTRLVLTKSEMLNMKDGLMPDKYFAVCKDDGKLYTYDKSATPNSTTGKFVDTKQDKIIGGTVGQVLTRGANDTLVFMDLPTGKEYVKVVSALPESPEVGSLYVRSTDDSMWMFISNEWHCLNNGKSDCSVILMGSINELPKVGKGSFLYIAKDTDKTYSYYDGAWHCLNDLNSTTGVFIKYDLYSELPSTGMINHIYYVSETSSFYIFIVESSVGVYKAFKEFSEISCTL